MRGGEYKTSQCLDSRMRNQLYFFREYVTPRFHYSSRDRLRLWHGEELLGRLSETPKQSPTDWLREHTTSEADVFLRCRG